MHVVQALGDGLRGRRHAAAAGLLVQMDHARAVGADQRVHDAVAGVARLEQHRAGAVAEQHAGGAVGVVDDRRHLVGADHHDLARGAVGDELRGDGQRIEKARAGRLHVERADILDADHVADQVGGRRKLHVRRGGGADQQIDLARLGAGLLQQAAHGLRGHMRGAEPLAFEDVALLDAGALGDPGVAGVHHARQFRIGEQVRRQVAVDGGNRGAGGTVKGGESQLSAMVYSRQAGLSKLRPWRGQTPLFRASCWLSAAGTIAGPRRRRGRWAGLADLHDGIEPGESLDLPPPFRAYRSIAAAGRGKPLGRAVALAETPAPRFRPAPSWQGWRCGTLISRRATNSSSSDTL